MANQKIPGKTPFFLNLQETKKWQKKPFKKWKHHKNREIHQQRGKKTQKNDDQSVIKKTRVS